MKRICSTLLVAVASLCLLTTVGCNEQSDDSGSTSVDFSTDGVVKAWASGCLAGSDTVTGGNHYKVNVTFNSGGNYNSSIEWYTGGSCSGLPITVVYGTSGTYAVGNTISGSAKQISFVVNSSYVMAGSVTVQTAFNNDCGGTSAYNSGANSSNDGVSKSSYMMNCIHMDFPNSSDNHVENIATFDGTVLTIGAPDPGLPGAFNTPPSSATLQLY